jgi:nicotinate-nucleotide adenylyltransferase
LLRITPLDISATAIRDRVRRGRSVRYLVPPPVEAYIARHGLYRQEDASR